MHRFGGDSRALIIGETEGLVKLVADADGPVLGVHIAGPWATELLARGLPRGELGGDARRIGALIHPHPTLSEMFGEAALALTGRSLHGLTDPRPATARRRSGRDDAPAGGDGHRRARSRAG